MECIGVSSNAAADVWCGEGVSGFSRRWESAEGDRLSGGYGMSADANYDAAIIGAGQAGGPLALALADAGWRVALIERKHVGGTCINEGCTPTKTMIASARVAYLAQRAGEFGVHVGELRTEMAAVRERKDHMVENFRAGSLRRLKGTRGLTLLRGSGRFIDHHRIEILEPAGASRKIHADKVFINTGLRPRIPTLEGLDGVPYLDSTTVTDLDAVPSHLLILGGGYIGVEFGQMFRRFGSDVTIIQRASQLLTHEDEDIAEEVAKILCDDGIRSLLETTPTDVCSAVGGGIDLRVRSGLAEEVLHGSHLLIAVGRVPNTEDLNVEAAGIEVDDRGFIPTDECLQTAVSGIYALGDVKGGPAFTHISYDDYRIVRANLLEGGDVTMADRLIPYTVFIDPQLGGIGITERQATHDGLRIRVAKMPMSAVARALEMDEARGVMKVLIDAETDRIAGASILGVDGGEMMAVLQMAMIGKLPYTVLRDAVFSHPSLSESLNNLFREL